MWRAVKTVIQQNRILFRPKPPLPRTPADLGLTYEEVQLSYGGFKGTCAWWIPQIDLKENEIGSTILYFHGSDGSITHELQTLRFLHRLGAHVFMMEYPGYRSRWGFPNEFDCYWAASAAWRYVEDAPGVDRSRIVLFGHSVGGAVAVQLATQVACSGLVLQSTFTSVPDLAEHLFPRWPARLFCFTSMNSLRRIGRCDCPVLVIHSPGDEHIPYAQARALYDAANPPKHFVDLRGSHWSRAWLQNGDVRAAWQQILAGETGAAFVQQTHLDELYA